MDKIKNAEENIRSLLEFDLNNDKTTVKITSYTCVKKIMREVKGKFPNNIKSEHKKPISTSKMNYYGFTRIDN